MNFVVEAKSEMIWDCAHGVFKAKDFFKIEPGVYHIMEGTQQGDLVMFPTEGQEQCWDFGSNTNVKYCMVPVEIAEIFANGHTSNISKEQWEEQERQRMLEQDRMDAAFDFECLSAEEQEDYGSEEEFMMLNYS